MKITVYTITDCQFSNQEKAYLQSKNVPFEEKNLEINREFLTEMLALSNNFAGTPVTKIEKDDGQIVVLKGFTQDEFDKALGFQTAAPTVAAPAIVATAPTPQPVTSEPAPAVMPPAPVMPVADTMPAQPPIAVVAPAPQMPTVEPMPTIQPVAEQPVAAAPAVMSPAPVMPVADTMPAQPPIAAVAPAPQMPTVEPMPTVQPVAQAPVPMPQDQSLNDILSSLQSKVADVNQNPQQPAAPQAGSQFPPSNT